MDTASANNKKSFYFAVMGQKISRHLITWAVGNIISLFIAQRFASALEPSPILDTPLKTLSNTRVAGFIFLYYVVMALSRLSAYGSHTLLELLWGCNVSMLQAVLGIATNQPLLVGSAVTTVAIDQSCWYVDLLGYALTKKFPVGVAKYLVSPETGKVRFYTSFHHIWFIPTIIWILRNHGGVRPGSWTVTCAVTAFLALFCRAFTPNYYSTATRQGLSKPTGHRGVIQLNVNLSHEFYSDVKVALLHLCDGRHPGVYLPFLVFVCNVVLNGPPYLLLRLMSSVYF